MGRRWTELRALIPLACFVVIGIGAIMTPFGLNKTLSAYGVFAIVLVGASFAYQLFREYRQLGLQVEAERERATRAELERQHEQEIIDSLADGLDVAIFLCDPRGTIEYANRAARELFAYRHPRQRSILEVSLSDELQKLVAQAAESNEMIRAELTFRYPMERVGIAQAWSEDSVGNRVFLSIYEITSLRRLERVRTDFVANVSHELRTPMTIVRAMAETLLDDEEADVELRTRYLNRIIREVDRLTSISDDLLTLTTAESQPIVRASVNLSEMVRSVVLQLREKAEAKGLDLNVTVPDVIMVSVSPTQMSQVIVNLVDNAINYTNEGAVDVSVRNLQNEVQLIVEDTGIGIDSDQLDRIFERFYRVDKGRSRQTGGTGLGLSIVKHIVEQHDGRITVESVPSKRSKFTVSLPLNPA